MQALPKKEPAKINTSNEVAPNLVKANVASTPPSEPIESEKPSALSTAIQPQAPEAAGALDATAFWQSVLKSTALKGIPRQLAHQSELVSFEQNELILHCEKASLATSELALNGLKQVLEKCAKAQNHAAPKLRVEVVAAGQIQQSPQKVAARQREESLEQARNAIEQNEMIGRIVKEFDGMILPNSITPD